MINTIVDRAIMVIDITIMVIDITIMVAADRQIAKRVRTLWLLRPLHRPAARTVWGDSIWP
jgi:hypothetical protein